MEAINSNGSYASAVGIAVSLMSPLHAYLKMCVFDIRGNYRFF
jgi:hypothetical protein